MPCGAWKPRAWPPPAPTASHGEPTPAPSHRRERTTNKSLTSRDSPPSTQTPAIEEDVAISKRRRLMWLRIRAIMVLICRPGEAWWSWWPGLRLLRAGPASTIRRDAAVDKRPFRWRQDRDGL